MYTSTFIDRNWCSYNDKLTVFTTIGNISVFLVSETDKIINLIHTNPFLMPYNYHIDSRGNHGRMVWDWFTQVLAFVCILKCSDWQYEKCTLTAQKFLDLNRYLSIGKQCVHSLEEARLQHVRFVKDEDNLLVPAARATQDCTQIIIKVSSSVLAMDLMLSKGIESWSKIQCKWVIQHSISVAAPMPYIYKPHKCWLASAGYMCTVQFLVNKTTDHSEYIAPLSLPHH